MLRKIVSEEILKAVRSAGIIGVIIGILSIGLDEEKTTMKGKIIGMVWAIMFSVISFFVMSHFDIVHHEKSSDYLVWAVVGFVSFNQKAIRKVARLIFASFTNNPFETIQKIKEIFKK